MVGGKLNRATKCCLITFGSGAGPKVAMQKVPEAAAMQVAPMRQTTAFR